MILIILLVFLIRAYRHHAHCTVVKQPNIPPYTPIPKGSKWEPVQPSVEEIEIPGIDPSKYGPDMKKFYHRGEAIAPAISVGTLNTPPKVRSKKPKKRPKTWNRYHSQQSFLSPPSERRQGVRQRHLGPRSKTISTSSESIGNLESLYHSDENQPITVGLN